MARSYMVSRSWGRICLERSRLGWAAAALAALAMNLGPVPASAQSAAMLGTPVTAETLVVQAELIRLADALDAAVDAKDWAGARSLFADDVAVDFTSLAGGAPAIVPADALIAAWSSNLTAAKTSFHLRGNHRVTVFDDGSAALLSQGYAWNRLEIGAAPENGGDALWEVWGVYAHRFVETAEGWRIDGMTFTVTAQRGNFFVRDTVVAD